jgi:nucleotide-binding universal stress UspA family protein
MLKTWGIGFVLGFEGSEMAIDRQINEYFEDRPLNPSTKEKEEQHRMVVVPFETLNLSPRTFEWALNTAQATLAELVFLCVRPPEQSMRYADEGEHLFSDLKGLQAQIQNCTVPVSIETVAGSTAQLVLDYVEETRAEIIVIPGDPVEVGAGITA